MVIQSTGLREDFTRFSITERPEMKTLDQLPAVSGTPDAATIITYLTSLLNLISGEVNFAVLSKDVIAAELTAPGWAGALNGVKADATNVFPDAMTRPVGLYLIGIVAKLVGVTLS